MFSNLKTTVDSVAKIAVSNERQVILQPLIDFIQLKVNDEEPVRLNFICTHNSRRSHLSQIWAQAMAFHFGIPYVYCYSGGTEATALFPKVAETLRYQGFEIQKLSEENNPAYVVKFAENAVPLICFSKKFDDVFNPTAAFAAIMTCSSADEGCPFIGGAEQRISVRYEDPKVFDETQLMTVKYIERSREIASEMYFVFSKIKV